MRRDRVRRKRKERDPEVRQINERVHPHCAKPLDCRLWLIFSSVRSFVELLNIEIISAGTRPGYPDVNGLSPLTHP